MGRAELLELAFLLWGDEAVAEARVDAVLRHRDTDAAVRALLRTRPPSVVSTARDTPWWVSPDVAARGERVAAALAALELRDRAAVVLVGLGTATPAELPRRFGLRGTVPDVLGTDARAALADRSACRRPPARDDVQAVAAALAARRRRWLRVAAAGLVAVGAVAWVVAAPSGSRPGGGAGDPAPGDGTSGGGVAEGGAEGGVDPADQVPAARLVRPGADDTPASLAVEVAVTAAGGGPAAGTVVWSGRFDTGVAGVVDAVVVRVPQPDGTALLSTAFAQGRENQSFLVAPCGAQPDGPVSAARCGTADPGTGQLAVTVLVTGLTGPATLVDAAGDPVAALVPGAGGGTTARDDAATAPALRLADGTTVAVTAP